MNKTSLIGQPLQLIVLAFAAIIIGTFSAEAAQDSYDIDLKELRPAPAPGTGAAKGTFDIDLKELKPAPVRRDPHPLQHRPTKPAPAEAALKSGRESNYTVRTGDNLFLILIRQYGLSNSAAERLIPEIVRRNDIRDPQKLTLGQRLIIPLPAKARTSPDKIVSTPPPAVPPAVPAVQPLVVESPREREIVLEAAAPCPLVRNLAKELGLLIPSLGTPTQTDNVSVGFDGVKMDVACGLTPAEAYTYERLLSLQGIQLLVFNGEVPPRRVVEELADRLGITFWLSNDNVSDDLPVTYIFPAANPAERGVRLTIRSAPATKTP